MKNPLPESFHAGRGFWLDFLQNYRSIRESEEKRKEPIPSPTHRTEWWWRVARIWLSMIVLSLPWANGAVQWQSQYLLLNFTWPLVLYVFGLTFISKSHVVKVPGVSIILVSLAMFALLQSSFRYPLAPGAWTPKVVQIQQWTMGQDVEISSPWFTPWMQEAVENSREIGQPDSILDRSEWISPESKNLIDRNSKLGPALSLDPNWSRSATVSLFMAACFVWLGCQLYSDPTSYRNFLVLMLLLGLGIAAHFFMQTVAWNPTNSLRIESYKAVGPFHNKNIGGAFLSLCFGASIGMTFHSFMGVVESKRKIDKRYKIATTSPLQKLIQQVIDGIGELKTTQIVCLITTAIIYGAIIATLSRGALLSASFAALATLLLSQRRQGSFFPLLVSLVIAIVAIGVVQGLDLEGDVVDRLERVGDEIDESKSQRLVVWKAVLKAFSFYLWTGSGLGTFRFAAIPFLESNTNLWFGYAESLLGHVLVEFGLIGLIAFLFGLYELSMLVRKFRRKNAAKSGGVIAYSASAFVCIYLVTHNLFDFGLIVPAIFVPACIYIGALYRLMVQGQRIDHATRRESPFVVDSSRTRRRRVNSPSQSQVKKSEGDDNSPIETSESGDSNPTTNSGDNTEQLAVAKLSSRKNGLRKQKRGAGQSKSTRRAPNSGNEARSLWGRVQSSQILLLVGALLVSGGLLFSYPSLRLSAIHEKWANELAGHLKASEPAEASNLPVPSIYSENSAEGLRLLGTQKLLTWRLQHQDFDSIVDVASPEWKLTSPIVIRLTAMELSRKNRDVQSLFGGEGPLQLWNESRLCFQYGHYHSPLDWRLMWGHTALDWTTSVEWQGKYAYRCAAMSQQRVPELFEISLVAEELDVHSLADDCYRSVLRRKPQLNNTIALVLRENRDDQSIDSSVFSHHAETLEGLADVHFPEKQFPHTFAALWNRIEEIAETIPRSDPKRSAWLAKIAKARGDLTIEIEMLHESLRLDPENERLWKRYLSVMMESNRQSEALKFIEESELSGGKRPEFARMRSELMSGGK